MLKMIFLLARRMFIRLLLVLLPLGLFMFLAQAIPLSLCNPCWCWFR